MEERLREPPTRSTRYTYPSTSSSIRDSGISYHVRLRDGSHVQVCTAPLTSSPPAPVFSSCSTQPRLIEPTRTHKLAP